MGTEGQRGNSVTSKVASPETISGGTGVVSLCLLIHLVCVGVVLASNLHRSSLQERLVESLHPYLGTLNLDPDFTPYHLTQGQPLEDDHFLEVEMVATDSTSAKRRDLSAGRLDLERGNRWGFARRRYRRLAYAIAYHARSENDHLTGILARAVAGLLLDKEAGRQAIVRCRQHESQPRRLEELATGFPEDPAAEKYHRTVYEADVWFADGSLHVQKRVTAQEVAPLGRTDTSPGR